MKIDDYTREKCYKCYRPKSSCMCPFVNKIETNTQFIILMHPKEFQKTKNGTGHLTHLSLKNSAIYIGIDFSNHDKINYILNNPKNNCYVLYPSKNSIKLNSQNINEKNKNNVIFIIDSTWACSKKILRVSKNLDKLPKISFEHTKISNFKIKTQPNSYCLSTIESTHCVLELLSIQKYEFIKQKDLNDFLSPFNQMVNYQLNCTIKSIGQSIRYKKPYKK